MMGISSDCPPYTHLFCLPAVDVIPIEALEIGIDLQCLSVFLCRLHHLININLIGVPCSQQPSGRMGNEIYKRIFNGSYDPFRHLLPSLFESAVDGGNDDVKPLQNFFRKMQSTILGY